MMANSLEQELLETFFAESDAMLYSAEAALLAGEQGGDFLPAVHTVFRAVHSIKGGAQSLNFECLAEVAHRGEDFLVPLRQCQTSLDNQTVNLMFEFLDVLKYQLSHHKCGFVVADNDPRVKAFLDSLTVLAPTLQKNSELEAAGTPPDAVYHPLPLPSSQFSTVVPILITGIVQPAAIMPKVQHILLVENLRDCGHILYEQFDEQTRRNLILVQTDLSELDIVSLIERIGYIEVAQIGLLGNNLPDGKFPSRAELDALQIPFCQLRNVFAVDTTLSEYIKQLSQWGKLNSSDMRWYPGGLAGWLTLIDLLQQAAAAPPLARTMLPLVWETIFHALCNQTYFCKVEISCLLADWNNQTSQFLDKAATYAFVFIDLSDHAALEPDVLHKLINLQKVLQENQVGMHLIAKGPFARRHLNTFEAAKSICGMIKLFESPFYAIMDETQQLI